MDRTLNNSIDRTTRIAAGATRTRYDTPSIMLHWTTVVLVLLQFGLAELWEDFSRPTRHLMIVAHMSFGILLTVVVVARIAWRMMPGHQVAPAVTGLTEIASKGVHILLYVMLVVQAVLGFVLRWSGNEAMSFFGLQIPPFFPPVSRATHHLINEAHDLFGWAIIIVALGHASAALFHHFILKDNVLQRMLSEGVHGPEPR